MKNYEKLVEEMNVYSIVQKEKLAPILEQVFEIIFQKEYKEPYDEDGHMEFSMEGKVFATNGAGGEFILLEDGTIGYNSGHGCMGRIAENMQEFLELIINCPYWEEFVNEKEYMSIERLRNFSNRTLNNFIQDMMEGNIIVVDEQKRVANCLNIKLYEDIAQDILMRLYITAKRTPFYKGVYTEENGEKNCIDGCVFTKEFE